MAQIANGTLEEAFFQALVDTNQTLRKWQQAATRLTGSRLTSYSRNFSTETRSLFNNHFKKCLVHGYASRAGGIAVPPYGHINRLLKSVHVVELGDLFQVERVYIRAYGDDCSSLSEIAQKTGYRHHWQAKLPDLLPDVYVATGAVQGIIQELQRDLAQALGPEKVPTMDDVFAGMASFKF